jgi:small-conductance mechanosensitive channel
MDTTIQKLEELQHLGSELQSISEKIEALQKDLESDSLVAEDTVYVQLFGQELWPVYLSFGPLSPQERVDLIHTKFDLIPFFSFASIADSLQIKERPDGFEIRNQDAALFYITYNDAKLLNKDPQELAQERILLLQNSLNTEKLVRSNQDIIYRILKLIGIITVLIVLIKLLGIGYRRLNLFIISKEGTTIKGIKIKDFEIVNDRQVTKGLLILSKILRLLIAVILVYISLPMIFGLLPWTQTIAETLLEYTLDPIKRFFWATIHFIPDLISIFIISYIGHFVIKFVNYISGEVENKNLTIPGFYPDWARPTANLLRLAIYAILLIFIFPFLPGSDSAIFKGVSVFIGVVITLGSSSSVANLVSGLIITYMRPYKEGDRIQIENIIGFVTEKSLLVTRLRTAKQEIITIPNSKILNTNIINFSTSIRENDGIIVHTKITIGYDVPWRRVHKALLTAADRVPTISKEPKPFVLQTALNDFNVEYEINAYVKDVKSIIGTRSHLNEVIQDVFRDENIEIMSPHYESLRDGSASTIPRVVKEDQTFKSETVEDNTPELDILQEQELEKELENKKLEKEKPPTNFADMLSKVKEAPGIIELEDNTTKTENPKNSDPNPDESKS